MAGVEQEFNPELHQKFTRVVGAMSGCSIKEGLDITANVVSQAIGGFAKSLDHADKIADEWAANVKLLIRKNDRILAATEQVDLAALEMWTVFDRPADHPQGLIARRGSAGRGGFLVHSETICTDAIEDMRSFMEIMGLTNIGRHDQDDPTIVEVWT